MPHNIDLPDTTEYIDDEPIVKDKKRDQDGKFDEGGPGSGPSGKPDLQPEQMAMSDINPNYNAFAPTPKHDRLQTDPELTRMTEDAPEPETPEDEEYAIYEEVPIEDDQIRLENIPYLSDAGEYICPECGDKFSDIETYETHLPAKEDSTISVAGPPAGTQPPANIIEEQDEEEVSILTQLLDNELQEQAEGHDEVEDIALITQLLSSEESKKKALKTNQK